MRKLGGKRGFTLVELSLSLVFIGILSITIVLIINNAISTYRRGLTLNQINTVGMDLVDDMRAAVQNSPAKSPKDSCSIVRDDKAACEEDNGKKLTIVKKTGEVDGSDGVPLFGAFCTGKYSYVWNSGYLFARDLGIEKASLNNEVNFRLAKVEDTKRFVCASVLNKYDNSISSKFESDKPDGDEIVILLAGGSDNGLNGLALYDLSSAVPAVNDDGTSAFYSISFILGTVQGGINVMSNGNFCATPDEYYSNFDYCAINKFNFAAQANGG